MPEMVSVYEPCCKPIPGMRRESALGPFSDAEAWMVCAQTCFPSGSSKAKAKEAQAPVSGMSISRTVPDLRLVAIGRGAPSRVPTCSVAQGARRGWAAANRREGIVATFWYPTNTRSAAYAGAAMEGFHHANHSRRRGAGLAGLAGTRGEEANCVFDSSINAEAARRSKAHSWHSKKC